MKKSPFLFKALGLGPEALHELADLIKSESAALKNMGLGDHAARQIEEAHSSTFYVYEGHDSLIETHRGARPGNPYADLVHEFLLTSIMSRVEKKERGKLESYPRVIGMANEPWG